MIIDDFSKYQIDWLTSHNDIAFNKEEEDLIIRFLKDTAEMYQRENECKDCISRQATIDALWKALYEYENKTEKQFIDSEELDIADWFQHRVFVQNMSDIDRQTILNMPSVTPKYTDEQIQKMQELEQAQLEKAYELGKAESFEEWLSSFNTESAPQCFNAVQELKKQIEKKQNT